MSAGSLTARELTEAYLQRIEKIDRAGPQLNAVIEINPDGLAIADQLDAERKAGRVRGLLHGIPILIKDNIATADQMETTAGSLALVGVRPLHDAHIVTRLRAAGAVILGKTNLSEWANYRSTASTSGWSGRGGQTRNPYALDRSPIGSSSGSGVAVAANLCVAAVGTETNGSIMAPASANGIVGIKPTVGLVSRTGIIPIAASQDTAGPMTRTVRDAAILLHVLTGPDPSDYATGALPANWSLDSSRPPAPGGLEGARIGVLRGPFRFHSRMDGLLAKATAQLREAGAELVDLSNYAGLVELGDYQADVLSYEFNQGINAYLASLGAASPMKSLADLIAFNEEHRAEEMPFMGQELFLRAHARGGLDEPVYREARAACLRLARTEGIDAMMAQHKLVAIVVITAGPAWTRDPVNGNLGSGGSAGLAAIAGYPSITVPATQVFGLPVGLSFVGRAWSEAKLLALAADFERVTQARTEPLFQPTVAFKARHRVI